MTWRADPDRGPDTAVQVGMRIVTDAEIAELMAYPDDPWPRRMPLWARLTVAACAVQVASAAGVLWVVLSRPLC